MDFKLRGKRAFVSGSSSGLGRAMAMGLAAEGCDVAVHGRDHARTEETARDIEALSCQAVAVYGDLATEEGCREVAASVQAEFGALDILVNNVGVALNKHDPKWHEMPPKVWLDSFEVNFMSTLRMSQHFVPGMRDKGWGRVINISTGGAIGTPIFTEYGSAKAALNKLTADMAKDLGPFGVTVNAISPGVIMTPATETWLTMTAKENGWPGDFADWERKYLTDTGSQAIGRFGRPEDVANLCAFLASDPAGHLTGLIVPVNGGANRTVYM